MVWETRVSAVRDEYGTKSTMRERSSSDSESNEGAMVRNGR